ncbi:MAG: NAD+ synthase [Fibrobacterota bacterium]
MKIGICQLNPIMGDIEGNTQRIAQILDQTAQEKPDLLVFPELYLQGYPPRDLLEHKWFIRDGLSALDRLCDLSRSFPRTGILTGIALPDALPNGKGLFNAAVLVDNGCIPFHQNKSLLPSYDVFDETRYFDSAPQISTFEYKGETLGITICEDAWNGVTMGDRNLYSFDPVEYLAEKGASLFINISASPFHVNKERQRFSLIQTHARKHKIPFVFVNQVGGNDELIFDGTSMVFDDEGEIRTMLPSFSESVRIVDTKKLAPRQQMPVFDKITMVHDALVLGIKDYLRKCGFPSALVGLSGGIDSAVTCALAVKALGAENVTGVAMPSRYSSDGSVKDAQALANNLGISFKIIPIESMYAPYLETLQPHFGNRKADVTEENLQARIRGNLLMALSNKFGSLLLATGNKSEIAVGYSTLYGDMNGGMSVISDLPKTMVYDIARHINRTTEVIPRQTITKPPSAELRPNQKDQDTLPPYDILDAILTRLIEEGASSEEIIAEGFSSEHVRWIVDAIKKNEYKRRQAATGLKVTPKAFGQGRRFPIAARYKW